ncbi:MAG TPA: tetratricopeptide repeat protein [Thermoanaerobaculia bacterium]|jgi:tetratricopeptide (TPR) repeat protein|nr:tetratricopeptide repeat protein [Thermoanaerobaculia bacterium]
MDKLDPQHPQPVLLTAFRRGRLSRRRSRQVVRHLLTSCTACRQAMVEPRPSYDEAFVRSRREVERRQSVLLLERAAAPALLRDLLAQDPERQWERVAQEGRFQTWTLCELLLDASRDWGFQNPARALELSQLGVDVAMRLDPCVYGETRVNDLLARAWVALGNAQRIRSSFREAEESFVQAESQLRQGTGDPLEKAHLLLHKASLLGNQQRFGQAFRLLDRVFAIARRCEDPQLHGRALITRGFLLGIAHDSEAAIRYLSEGIRKLDPVSDLRLLVAAHHNLTLYLTESGKYHEALHLLESARPLYHQVGDQMSLLRLRWLEGKIAVALGQFPEAEELLREVRKELIARDLGFDTALLSLDLADIYARQGRGAEMRRLAEEMIPIFRSRDVHREGLAALLAFQKAAEMECVTLGLIRDVSGYLKENRAAAALRSRELR